MKYPTNDDIVTFFKKYGFLVIIGLIVFILLRSYTLALIKHVSYYTTVDCSIENTDSTLRYKDHVFKVVDLDHYDWGSAGQSLHIRLEEIDL